MTKLLALAARSGILCLSMLLLLASRAFADAGQVAVTETRVTDFPQVVARLTVNGPSGSPLPVLTADNLTVTEDGQPVRSFVVYPLAQSPNPLGVVIAIDVSGSMNDDGKLPAAKAAAKEFVAQLRPIDQVELISFSDKLTTVVPLTRDKKKVAGGIDGLKANGNTLLYDAASLAVDDDLRTPGTHLVVVLTDGEDTASRAKLSSVLDLAKQTRVPLYTIGLGSDVRDAVLARMADESGGHYFKAPRADDLAAAFKLLTQQLANQYELYYASALPFESARQVEVDVQIHAAAAPGAGAAPVSLGARFAYLMPTVKRDAPAPIDPGQLQAVVEPAPPVPPPAPAPSPITPELAGVVAAAAVVVVVVGFFFRTIREPVDARLGTFVVGLARSGRRWPNGGSGIRPLSALLGWLAGLGTRFLPARQVQQTQRNLDLAGNPFGWGAREFIGARTLTAVGLGALGYLGGLARDPGAALLYAIIFGALGFLLPVLWLGSRMAVRRRLIFRAMPNALDLLAVTVEAGLGLDQAIAEVCLKWRNELTREFAIYLAEMQVGRDRREALRGIAERTGVPELNSFVGALIQAEELGTGIARTLAIQAEQIRIKQRQDAEKRAHEASVKMLFPLVFLMFPAIFVVILGPAIPPLLQTFQGMAK